MKVCYVAVDVALPHFRGASTHVYEVSKNLTRLGHEVHVVSRRIHPTQPPHEVLDGIHVHRIFRGIVMPLPSRSYALKGHGPREGLSPPGLIDRLYERYLFTVHALHAGIVSANIIRRYNLDIVLERETSFGAGAVASLITGRPMILEIIGPRYSKLSLMRARKILIYTQSMLRNPVRSDRLVFVEASADTEKFRPNEAWGRMVREKYGLGGAVVVGYVGTFAGWHGIEDLIHASLIVARRCPNVRFLMVGPNYEWAERLTAERGVKNLFTFTGPIPYDQVPWFINAADVLVAPYNPARSELRRRYGIGSPLKLFEYMACGKPVVATAVPPIRRVVRDGVNALLVPPGDVNALADAIIRLIEDPPFAGRLGKTARKEVVGRYSWEHFASRLQDLMGEVLEETALSERGGP